MRLVCSVLHYLCGIYPDIADTRDDYSRSLSVVQQTNSVLGRLISEFSVSHTMTHTHPVVGLLCKGDQLVAGADIYIYIYIYIYIHNTQHSQQTNIHAISRILTRDPSNQAAADLRLRQRDQRNRPTKFLIVDN